ncbi:MAG: hypothetical protein ACTHMI_12210 [Mucilaginibacter sp.]
MLIPFLRNLGKGVLPIGGNSGDELAVEATIRSTGNSLTPTSTGCWFEKAIN